MFEAPLILTRAVLIMYASGLLSGTLVEVVRPVSDGATVNQAKTSPCPDPEEDGHPCGPACTCSCCPGHAPIMLFALLQSSPRIPPSNKLRLHPRDDLHPKDILHRIFHPPRG
jgi:hypothetical protein